MYSRSDEDAHCRASEALSAGRDAGTAFFFLLLDAV